VHNAVKPGLAFHDVDALIGKKNEVIILFKGWWSESERNQDTQKALHATGMRHSQTNFN